MPTFNTCGAPLYTLTTCFPEFFQPQCVYIRFTHITNMQPKFYTWALQCIILSTESTVDLANISNSPTRDWSKPNWHFAKSVHLGSDPHLYRQSGLSKSRSSPYSRMATSTKLSLHLSILPPKEGSSQETHSQHQRTIRPCHPLASCQTQIHSTTGSPSFDVITVSKPSRTLDYRPRLRIKHQGEIRTNEDATVQ